MRPLTTAAAPAAIALLEQDPIDNALAGSRLVDITGTRMLSREFSGLFHRGDLTALLWHGISLSVMGEVSQGDLELLAERARRARREYASVVGPSRDVARLWPLVRSSLGRPREFRWTQLMMLADQRPSVAPSDELRFARPEEADLVFPAAVAMFKEEVGTDPTAWDGGRSYRDRVEQLIAERRTAVVRRGDDIVFKADVGAIFGPVAQIHGVWTAPAERGKGLGSAAMARAVQLFQLQHSTPQVTLYVNDFNSAARRAYTQAGFRQVGEFASLLF
ncbi:GNAT family N-acetyltransferase [Helcobacillus massiliensis]|uniref:GNAT family N-acetyltransferase n=1 Tax=Helcobacillus massiliensis TaxID=521392 RepID=UPI0021A3A159|nr:GNAT family N-acetyltransferase [Helcobacillus massiliensis]MCT1557889.1 GNAT family N-acetyltransferase [Helcobacillus massiliensis]MCT2036513.1 GNAT family N-acetyltransferase [Helcobacillus massiliensis]MCT2332586.1 GNAT family N-acetyltransferase [Helcobacillus massiliensis]MDK7742764.1 GNAT family N-acetyltransferase [Helcobacillus massiliensis]WOO93304.1 GNAT family N-acetyltransferase [Helcobacillus massiliensis]